ncbi:GNAT family N-acetyltransferase [uncultured Sphaerochaeta sp.]|uniref:GNAT family N-acetyltransferase n=1 Tax=uncultured Sphaerochaeta sp. TaxID=886478 RepID=UPI002A0A2312|nr:GNAT family N-acetyltransferase [uncultured Sphaerochaeta sp.]
MQKYWLNTPRLSFSIWTEDLYEYAFALWGNPLVTRYLCATGCFLEEEIRTRLNTEIFNKETYGVQYWPIFLQGTSQFIGSCGLRPYTKDSGAFEFGFYLLPQFHHMGYAQEASQAVFTYAFSTLHAKALYCGHHSDNAASRTCILRLGFKKIGEKLYPPTGLLHPLYRLNNAEN